MATPYILRRKLRVAAEQNNPMIQNWMYIRWKEERTDACLVQRITHNTIYTKSADVRAYISYHAWFSKPAQIGKVGTLKNIFNLLPRTTWLLCLRREEQFCEVCFWFSTGQNLCQTILTILGNFSPWDMDFQKIYVPATRNVRFRMMN